MQLDVTKNSITVSLFPDKFSENFDQFHNFKRKFEKLQNM